VLVRRNVVQFSGRIAGFVINGVSYADAAIESYR